ncbi:hypothetical protein IT774_13560 [Salinimonas marina]|uniref:PEP-CTERM sorting domain-containing protein n=1 Tax=Salinimonas marina TaxID=2785918 RepID=A0A7S9DWB1_9ALTE|nr:hypothetical protein [Salinimonas marina]QPG05143.1 hypothetical protein IT774_13560 [Salinimonas marina]
MKKSAIFGAFALLASSQASASYIETVTGADMTDMSVTVTYSDASTETLLWQTLATDPGPDYQEGFVGGVFGSDWSLVQQGNTISETPADASLPLGLWTFDFEFTGVGIQSIFIDAFAGNVVFDTAEGDASANGSGPGRGYLDDVDFAVASYTNNVEDELFGGLLINGISDELFAQSGTLEFLIDTDMVAVSAPATASIFALGLAFIGFGRKKNA